MSRTCVALALAVPMLLTASGSRAQIAVRQQPGMALLEALEKLDKEKLPAKDELLALKPEPVPKELEADLLANDWALLGGYLYNDKRFSVDWGVRHLQYLLKRYLPDGGVLEFQVAGRDNGAPKVTHTNFQEKPTVTQKVVRKGGAAYLAHTAHGETSHSRVLRYQRGVLVIDITRSGKVGDPKTAFREVWVALPKTFGWRFGE